MNPYIIRDKVIIYCNPSVNKLSDFYDIINNQYLSLNSYEVSFKDKYYELPNKESRIEIPSNIVPFDSPACFLSLKLNPIGDGWRNIIQIPGNVTLLYNVSSKKFYMLTKYGKVSSRILTEKEISNKINIYIDFINCKFCINADDLYSYPIYDSWGLDGGENIRIGRGNWRTYFNTGFNLYEFGFLNNILNEQEVKFLFTCESNMIKSSVKNIILNNKLFREHCILYDDKEE